MVLDQIQCPKKGNNKIQSMYLLKNGFLKWKNMRLIM